MRVRLFFSLAIRIAVCYNKEETTQKSLANEKHSIEYATEKMNMYIGKAESQLDKLGDNEACNDLRNLMYYCIKREK